MIKKLATVLWLVCGMSMQVWAMEVEKEEEPKEKLRLWMPDLSKNTDVEKLDLSSSTLNNLDLICFFPNLKELNLSSTYLGNNYGQLSQLTKLEKLNLYCIEGLTTAKYLTPLISLTYLKISCPNIGKTIKYLAQLPNLKELRLGGGFHGVEKVSRLTSLDKLSLMGIFNNYSNEEIDLGFPPLDFLSCMVSLKELDLSSNDYIFYIKPIVKLPNLENLNLSGCKNIKDLQQLKKLKSLIKLNLIGVLTLEEDLEGLADLPNLKKLTISTYAKLPRFFEQVTIKYR